MSQYAASANANSAPPAHQQQSPATQQSDAAQPEGLTPLQSAQHKRVYQACIPCRRRKVRCDLGSVDNPHDPPCVRCRRESKECYFSATRRKRKNDEDGEEDYVIRNGRKKHALDASPPPPTYTKPSYSNVPLTPGGSTGRTQPLRRPDIDRTDSRGTAFSDIAEDASARLENLEAQTVMRREVYGPHDALDLLYKAATDHPHTHTRQESVASSVQPPQAHATGRAPARETATNGHPSGRAEGRSAEPIDPRLMPPGHTHEGEKGDIEKRVDVSHEPGYEDALKAWGRFRFVRAGWFTREEAVKYITYYYEFLSPMTPISPPTYRNPTSHPTLLTEEPILTVTLLTIASRYYQINTTGGHCRSHAIHEELWRYLRRMIERCLWGQEAFGGGFCGSGADQTSSTAPERGLRKGSLRTLGTIESLMILTEWHPRALHFPPEEAIDELMLPSYDQPFGMGPDEDASRHAANHIPGGGRRIEGWLEPAWRSDRMCWMLLSTAMALAYELGVFDNIDVVLAEITRPEYEDEGYRLRATRIKRLLMIYLTQLAGRLGWTNMVPESIRTTDPYHSGQRRPTSHEGNTPGTNISNLSNINYVPDIELDDQIIHCWVGISNAMHNGNEKLFRSHKHTTHIIQSGEYTTELQKFQPILKDWWKTFEQIRMPTFIRHILTIEYEYVRIYVNSLALQAVVERSTTNAGNPHNTIPNFHSTTMGAPPTQVQTQNLLGALPLGTLGGFGVEDQEFIKEVVNGCRNLLKTVVDGLLPGGYLKHAPVRTYFRIISGAMFLLKTFALGAPKSDVELSISLMDRTVDALRDCVVDDVHLGTRFGDLLESLTLRLRVRFKHAPHNMAGETSQAASVNGQSNGMDTGYADHALKLRDGLLAPDRSTTPALPISATPFDNPGGIFPYPTGSSSIFRPSTPATAGVDLSGADNLFEQNDWTNPDDQMWYLPTGPGLFQTGENANVTMTDQGVNIGGMDLLDFMTMDPTHFDSLNATAQY
ncbi:putative Zn(2)-C6 fungal-type domain-containing protein [Seiridium cardinale]